MTKLDLNSRFFLLIKTILFCFFLSAKCYADGSNNSDRFIVLGEDSAKVKIKVFSSFTCPHCANFHFEVLPEIKKIYVDNGSVQVIFIDFPLDQAAFNASKLLHCVSKNDQIKFMDSIYKKQKQWTNGSNIEDINKNLKKIVKNLGISSARFDECLIDEAISDKILNGRIDAGKKYSINSTPTIVINEKKLEGSVSFKSIKKKIEKII